MIFGYLNETSLYECLILFDQDIFGKGEKAQMQPNVIGGLCRTFVIELFTKMCNLTAITAVKPLTIFLINYII